MLNFFPEPYQDELWYSVLSRYHARSGNTGPATTTKELFGKGTMHASVFFTNKDFGGIFGRLPSGLLSKERIYHRHTMIPYALRFSSEKRKQTAWDYVVGGGDMKSGGHLFSMADATHLRYCPMCNAEDAEQYGEMCWHRLHQIPLMPLCPVHGCRLEDSTVEVNAALGRRFILPTSRNCSVQEPRFGAASYDKELTNMLNAFLIDELPQESGFWCSVLSQALKNAGLVFMEVEAHLVWERLVDFYDDASYIGRCFRRDRMQQTLYRILKGQWTSPEQYALLAVALGVAPGWLTTPGYYIEDTMKEKLLEMAGRGYVWKKQRVADELNVKVWALDSIIRRLGIEPFWKTWHGISGEDTIVRIRISKEEKTRYEKRVVELGTSDFTEYVKYCIRKENKR